MEWQIERQSFRNITPSLSRNSQLKKKILYVKRIKNLDNTNIQTLISELQAENMEQFYTEIISTVLSIKPCNTDEIKNIIRVLSVYIKDLKFVSLLFSTINKHILESLKSVDRYWYSILFIELKTILDPNFDSLFYLKEFYTKAILEVKILLLEYLLEFHDTNEAKGMCQKESRVICKYFVKVDSDISERMEIACSKLGIQFNKEDKTENDFKAIVVPLENEFDWYVNRNDKIEQYNDGLTIKEIILFIKSYHNDALKIDSVCRALKQAENLKLIPIIWTKLKNNICYYPVLARIIKNLGSLGRKFVKELLEDFQNHKTRRNYNSK
ncbi:hypothetical protein NBO_423g0004 [Nosema bombycis CQ1]|uniref:Uncharacterized protein n=1 Tax=Nosema bombycis (strain CQ1 / CVCC 102059) TaxID=578461 RepID=R0MEH0_NOSB1|nr:hypothetical protein NBO_423g0004 [Nosema bombycis CQ1]|eukprot:EOB12500.1 hypothetical protein NBO_423g0004 [Nosema bombycis CQ1]